MSFRPSRLAAAFATAAALCAPLAALAAAAPSFSSLVVFGDSLSDSGNNAILIGADPDQVVTSNSYVAMQPYASGTYSEGPVWVTPFAQGLGLSIAPSLAGGGNYAYGGAQTRGGFPPSLRAQVEQYAATGAAGAGDALFVIAGGGNNARETLERIATGAPPLLSAALAARQYANDVGLMVDQLQALGARQIVVWNAPDLGYAPSVLAEGSQAASFASALTGLMNGALANRLAGEVGVTTFDFYGLVSRVAAAPSDFGFVNVADACGAVLGCDPAGFLFWDGVHPTSAGHSVIAGAMFDTLGIAPVPELGTFAMFAAGGTLLLMLRRRRPRAG